MYSIHCTLFGFVSENSACISECRLMLFSEILMYLTSVSRCAVLSIFLVFRLYTLDGKLLQNGSDLENGQIYVAVGREKFKKLPYGDLLFSKSTMRRPPG